MDQFQRITSRENPKIKHAKSVRDGRSDEFMFIEGTRLVEEALRSELKYIEAFVSGDDASSPRIGEIVRELEKAGVPIYEVPAQIARSLSDTVSGQGVILVAERPEPIKLTDIALNRGGVPIVLFLEKINNPSNLGAVLRTAEAAGVQSVIISEGSADPFLPKALRASMGSAFRIPIVQDVTMEAASAWAARSGLITTGADISASVPHTITDWKLSRLLVIGSEAHGLSADMIQQLDELTVIKLANSVESLNLAVASGILLFEAKRQNETGT
jgi:TrmH family RNA methyltransferase